MASNLSAPSFSLGLDLDSPDEEEEETLNQNHNFNNNINNEEEDDDFEEVQERPLLKRLRRGPVPSPPPVNREEEDDDIESFSSQEDDIHPSLHNNVNCSSSKPPLHSRGILYSQSTNKLKTRILPAHNASTSASFEAISNNGSFPSLTISPLRKFNLRDSDPSFSLGLNIDEEKENEEHTLRETLECSNLKKPENRPILKRLRRGLPPLAPSSLAEDGNMNVDVENISSQEHEDTQHPDISTSLQNSPSNKLKTPIISRTHNTSLPSSFEASSSKNSLPKSTISPLRKIHLLHSDSDSDDPTSSKGKIDSKKKKAVQFQSDTFWKDFTPKENIKICTPALDEFCNEYFNSSKNKNLGHDAPSLCSSKVLDPDDSIDDFDVIFKEKGNGRKCDHNWDFPYPKPPAYQYFFHGDPRVKNLVREHLPNFVPIGVENRRGAQQSGGDELDYMSQFGHGSGQNQGTTNSKNSSRRNSKGTKQKRPRNNAKSNEDVQNTGDWVNPRNNATVPKDAGKRRVSAVGSQGGHWVTGQDGRKVYVAKNGQELTGQFAYRQYKRESGTGFRKRKKAATPKKKKK